MDRRWMIVMGIAVLLMLALVACGGGEAEDAAAGQEDEQAEVAGDAEAGAQLFVQSCSACHGEDAKGLPSLGKDLTTSTFVASQSNEELLQFVKTGRPMGDPENTTGVDMPPKGGNPALTDQQILDIIAHIRTIHE